MQNLGMQHLPSPLPCLGNAKVISLIDYLERHLLTSLFPLFGPQTFFQHLFPKVLDSVSH